MNQLPRQISYVHSSFQLPLSETKIKRSISQQPLRIKQAHEESSFNMTQASSQKHIFQNENIEQFSSPVQEINQSDLQQFSQRLNSQRDSNVYHDKSSRQFFNNDGVVITKSIQDDISRMYENNMQDSQMKITLLITENERLIHINEGLMKENSSLKQLVNNSRQQKQISTPQVGQMTTANDQLRIMIQQVEYRLKQNQFENEQRVATLLRENERLNVILTERLNEIDLLRQDHHLTKDNVSQNYEEERTLQQEKISTLERQKELLQQQVSSQDNQQLAQQLEQSNLEKQHLQYYVWQLQTEYQNQQIGLQNIYLTQQVQAQELHANYTRALQDQQTQLQEKYKTKMEKVMVQISQELSVATQRETKLLDDTQQRQEEWQQERQSMQEIIERFQDKRDLKEALLQESINHTPEIKREPSQSIQLREFQQIQHREPQQIKRREPQQIQYRELITEPQERIDKENTLKTTPSQISKVQAIETRKEDTDNLSKNSLQDLTNQKSLGVYSLNTYKRNSKSQYDPSTSISNNTDYYSKYARVENSSNDVSDRSDRSRILQQNSQLNNQAQENCRQIMNGSKRQ